MNLAIISFGYLHGWAPKADLVTDLRPYRDPHVDPAMRELTGLDERVIHTVLGTPGITEVLSGLVMDAFRYTETGPATFAFGCSGGRHRSVVVANKLAALVGPMGITTTVVHTDIHRPVVNR
jgi:UPF0042 nucleotide-binding protein